MGENSIPGISHDEAIDWAESEDPSIATAYAPGSKYKVFWALVMAG